MQRELKINLLERKVLEHENHHERDQQEIGALQKQIRDLNGDIGNQRQRMEEAMKRGNEDQERVKRECEYAENKVKNKSQEEKEALKKEYESLIESLRTEYSRLTETLR